MLLWPWLDRTFQLPNHCDPQNRLLVNLSSSFETCIPTNLALFSTILGSFSILAWLFAQVPQIYKNWKLRSTAGLSIFFLLEWCLGDTANLVGALLTKQATWQVIVAAYYTFVDCVLVSQYIYFTYFLRSNISVEGAKHEPERQWPDASGNGIQRTTNAPDSGPNPTPPRAVNRSRDPIFDTFRFPAGSPSPREKLLVPSSRPVIRNKASSTPASSPKTVLLISLLLALLTQTQPHASPLPIPVTEPPPPTAPPTSTVAESAGQMVSWASTALYLGSRLPQIIKNARRRSTSGLSPSLFIAAFFGNFFYSASLLTNPLAWSSYGPYGGHGWAPPEGSDRGNWVLLATPFFLGAAGVLVLDAAVGLQFLIYGEGSRGDAGKKVVPVVDEGGKLHWRKVSGWMRGWVPSPRLGPRRVDSFASGLDAAVLNVDGARFGEEDQRPLLARDSFEEGGEDRRGYGTSEGRRG